MTKFIFDTLDPNLFDRIESPEQWHALRAEHGGSSEAAALFDYGYANMPSAWTVWALKTGKISADELFDEDDDRIWYGQELQGLTSRAVTRKMGWELHDAEIYVRHAILKMGSTVDYYITGHEDGFGILECKNRDYFRWLDDYTEDEASMKDRIQLAHQFACHPDITWGAIAVLVGGNDLKVYPYTREQLVEQILDVEDRWQKFWKDLDAGIEPSLTGAEIPNWLKVHFEAIGESPEPIKLPDGIDATIVAYEKAKAEASAADKIKKDAQAKLLEAMQERGTGISNMHRVGLKVTEIAGGTYERKPFVRSTLNIKLNDGAATGRKPDADATSQATLRAAEKAQSPL